MNDVSEWGLVELFINLGQPAHQGWDNLRSSMMGVRGRCQTNSPQQKKIKKELAALLQQRIFALECKLVQFR